MKITRIVLHLVNVPETHWWWSDDEHGQPGHQSAEHFVAEVETDAGLTGLTQIERLTAPALVEETVRGWLGTDVLTVNLAERPSALCKSFEQAVLDLLQAERDLLSARIQLHDALGGHWTSELNAPFSTGSP